MSPKQDLYKASQQQQIDKSPVYVKDERLVTLYRRIYGALAGLAYGDARGQPFVFYTPSQIQDVYGANLDWPDPIPAPGRRPWMWWEVSDETFQTLAVAQSLFSRRRLDPEDIAQRLGALPGRYASAYSAIETLRDRLRGIDSVHVKPTMGAAMRIAPVALAFHHLDLHNFTKRVLSASSISHRSPRSLAGAASIAGFLAATLREETIDAATEYALSAARIVERAYGDDGPRITQRILEAMEMADRDLTWLLPDEMDKDEISRADVVVPTAFAVFWQFRKNLSLSDAVFTAVKLGADADTLGAMVGCLTGCVAPTSVPVSVVENIESWNSIDLADVALELWRMTLNPSSEM